jgi:hypothetical protein
MRAPYPLPSPGLARPCRDGTGPRARRNPCEHVDQYLTCRRVAALADPGEILVSRTVRDLVAGAPVRLDSRGEHELKGVPGSGEVFAVTS